MFFVFFVHVFDYYIHVYIFLLFCYILCQELHGLLISVWLFYQELWTV